jgi:hypothetical protein
MDFQHFQQILVLFDEVTPGEFCLLPEFLQAIRGPARLNATLKGAVIINGTASLVFSIKDTVVLLLVLLDLDQFAGKDSEPPVNIKFDRFTAPEGVNLPG